MYLTLFVMLAYTIVHSLCIVRTAGHKAPPYCAVQNHIKYFLSHLFLHILLHHQN